MEVRKAAGKKVNASVGAELSRGGDCGETPAVRDVGISDGWGVDRRRSLLGLLRRHAQHDVEAGRQFANLGFRDRLEVGEHGAARLLVAQVAKHAIAFVIRMAVDQQLRGQHPLSVAADAHMDVRRAAGVGHGFDRAKIVLPGGTGQEPPVALEVLVASLLVAGAAVQVRALVVHLPDFDERVAEWRAGRVEDTAREVRDFTHGGRDRIVDDQQVVVGVERQAVRVERPFGQGRGLGEFLGENPGSQPAGTCKGDSLQETTTIRRRASWHGMVLFWQEGATRRGFRSAPIGNLDERF
jgi:hypothetical protein